MALAVCGIRAVLRTIASDPTRLDGALAAMAVAGDGIRAVLRSIVFDPARLDGGLRGRIRRG